MKVFASLAEAIVLAISIGSAHDGGDDISDFTRRWILVQEFKERILPFDSRTKRPNGIYQPDKKVAPPGYDPPRSDKVAPPGYDPPSGNGNIGPTRPRPEPRDVPGDKQGETKTPER